MPHRYRELKVWQKGMDLAVEARRFSKAFPRDEQYVLTSQIRRAANTVPLNIAEGAGCRTDKEFAQFLGIAFRSCHEVCTAAELAVRFEYVDTAAAQSVVRPAEELANMLYALMQKIEGK